MGVWGNVHWIGVRIPRGNEHFQWVRMPTETCPDMPGGPHLLRASNIWEPIAGYAIVRQSSTAE